MNLKGHNVSSQVSSTVPLVLMNTSMNDSIQMPSLPLAEWWTLHIVDFLVSHHVTRWSPGHRQCIRDVFHPLSEKNFSHCCFPIFLMIFTSCKRITENSDLANSGIPRQVALLMKNAKRWYGMWWDGSAFLVKNDENDIRWWPVLVWTVNFTLSFSDRASDISTFGDVKF